MKQTPAVNGIDSNNNSTCSISYNNSSSITISNSNGTGHKSSLLSTSPTSSSQLHPANSQNGYATSVNCNGTKQVEAGRAQQKPVRILHFNDCYNVEQKEAEPKGGAARFKNALDHHRTENTLVLFSGDILGPSIMSTITKGMHMAPVLNQCRVNCAVLGNHDFDFGIDNLAAFMKETNFPWLMSNVVDLDTNKPLGDGKEYEIIDCGGIRFGLIGLVEEEWLATLSTISKEDVIFTDYIYKGRRLARFLKNTHKVDYVIALTHMRTPNDKRLVENVEEIDLFLGGHDHDYEVLVINNKHLIKSGTDFREFSVIDLFPLQQATDSSAATTDDAKKKFEFSLSIKKVDVVSTLYDEDEALKESLKSYTDTVEAKIDTVLGHFACDMEGRFSHIRTGETNLGNFITDIMLGSTHSDCAILNSGTLRSDRIHKKGPFKMRDLFQILPMLDPMIVLDVTGYQIWKALENGVAQYPKFEGRFPQVAGVRFAFDPRKPSGQRVDPKFVKIGDEHLDLKQRYRLVTKSYLHQGKDGYDVLKGSRVLIEEEEAPELLAATTNHFEAINKILTGDSGQSNTHHRQSLVCVSRRSSLIKHHDHVDGQANGHTNLNLTIKSPDKHTLDVQRKSARRLSSEFQEIEFLQCRLEPKVEGRIIKITNDAILAELEKEYNEYCDLQKFDELAEDCEEMQAKD